ncbi:YbaB/EbfC family nucleoid-associated protein [Nonomuraea sp. PA05]|uniref:YbaB/EbfC family nucleoid-associated protein n=1 Tax=Nonomuraea sp. PA05 TaxID=2604466 RepID=UPI0021CCCB30|nr:YbaB/EbfC family nucleoid-associated protein [Nonomuraea sp. PA05]
MLEDRDVAGLRAYADELRDTFMRMQREASDLNARAQAIRITEKSLDGLVSATVSVRGELIRLDLDPRVFRRPDARGLADTITDTVRRAAARAVEELVELFEPVIPPEQLRAHLDGDLDTVLDQLSSGMSGEGRRQ